MAKYDITYSCGHEDVIELFGKSVDRERKIEYFEKHGLCKECYKKMKQEEEASKPLTLVGTILPEIDENGEPLALLYFTGNAAEKEELIMKSGYQLTDIREEGKYPRKLWAKKVTRPEIFAEIEAAKKRIGVEYKDTDDVYTAKKNMKIAEEKRKVFLERKEKGIVEPEVPELVKGKKWNEKIYGRVGKYSIYPDGEKTEITDEQAEGLREYLKKKEEYYKTK